MSDDQHSMDERIYERFAAEMQQRQAATMFTEGPIDVKAESQKIADSIDTAIGAVVYEDVYGKP